MTAPKNSTSRNVVTAILITLFVLVGIAGVAQFLTPTEPQELTADEIYQITGHPVTSEQSEAEFDRKYAHGGIARMRETQRAVLASKGATQPQP